MTVVFAFADMEKRFGFLGSDNLEGHAKKVVDKVEVAFDRYGAVCFGTDIAFDAFKLVGFFGGKRYSSGACPVVPETAKDLGDAVAQLLPIAVEAMYKSLKRALGAGRRSQQQFEHMQTARGHLLVLDMQSYSLHHLDFGQMFPPRRAYLCSHTEIEAGQVWRYSINAPTKLQHEAAPLQADPQGWLVRKVDETRAEVEAHGLFGQVGEAGAYLLVKDGERVFQSAFSSPEDLARSVYEMSLNSEVT